MSVELYQRKLELFQRLGGLSEKMAAMSVQELLDNDESFAALEKLMEERQEIMAAVDELNAQLGEETAADYGEEMAARLRAEADRIEALNDSIESTVKAVLVQLKERTKKIREGKHTHRAYTGKGRSAEGSFIDQRR